MILVVGSTGLLGSEVCRQLAMRKHQVRALVRPTAMQNKLDALRACRAELVTGDLKDPPSLEPATHGATAIISTASATLSRQAGDSIETVDLKGQLNLVEAAKSNGVRRFIFVSFRDDPQVQHPLTVAKRAVEQAIRDLDYTILQASWFMQVWFSAALGFDYQNANARIYGSGQNKISWVSFPNVAEFCVAAVENPAARRRIIELGGPEPLSPLEVVRIFEDETGRKFQVEHVPEEALQAQMAAATDSLQRTFAGLMVQYAHGDSIDMRPVLQQFPIPLTSVRDYAKSVLRTRAVQEPS
jgi:uncharacterized protein YbjT (DUF2867 family)